MAEYKSFRRAAEACAVAQPSLSAQVAQLGREAFFLAVPEAHRLARGSQPIRFDQLQEETVLLLEDGHCFRDQALDVCRRGGADEASVRGTSLSTLTQMVASGTQR